MNPQLATILILVAGAGIARLAMHLSYKHGYHRGSCSAHVARAAFLGQRLSAVGKGTTKMTLDLYTEHALSTVASKIYDDKPRWWNHITHKLGGEAGEFQEHVGKASRDDGWDMRDGATTLTPERRLALLKELGDILWYIVIIARELGSSLAEVMLLNITKRTDRKARGVIQGAGDNR